MKDYLKKNGIRAAVVLLVLVLLVGGTSLLLNGRAGVGANAAGNVSGPVQRAVSAALSWFEDIYGYIYKYDRLEAENEELRAQVAELQQEVIDNAAYQEENERLRQLLDLSEKHSDFVFESAKITDWTSSNWASSFTISKGSLNSENEISVGNCVVTEYGALVGQVIEVGDTWCTVRTIIDSSIDVGALVGETESAGMCVGDFALMQEGCLKLTYLSESAQLVEGEAVLTSGKGTYVPEGLVIGYIRSVLSEANGQTLYGVVEPACDLGSLSQVFVITDFTVQE